MLLISYPLANGASQGFYCQKVQISCFLRKNRFTKTALAAKVANFFSLAFVSGSMKDQINTIFCKRPQTDRQTHRQIL